MVVPQAVLDDIVLQIVYVGVSSAKDARTKQRVNKDSIDVASPGGGRQPRLSQHNGLVVGSLSNRVLDCLLGMLLSLGA